MTNEPSASLPKDAVVESGRRSGHVGDGPESRQFDFWIGHWEVRDPEGQLLGHNSIRSDLDGCVLRESWIGVSGSVGTSVNFHDPASRRWHQVWTDNSGQITHYAGEWREGAMRFRAEGFGDADGVHHHRTLDFFPNPDGSVRQWMQDSDDGTTWETTFDGTYIRAAT